MVTQYVTEKNKYSEHAHLNRYLRVGVYPDGAGGHRVVYEGACFICGAPLTVHRLCNCKPNEIPDMIKDRFVCDEHG